MDGIEAVGDAVGGSVGMVLGPVVESMSEPALRTAAQMAAEKATEKMCEKFEPLRSIEGLMDNAVQSATDAAMGYFSEICEWCKDFGDDPMEAFHAVGVLVLRACRAAVQAAVDYCLQALGGCLTCMCPCLASMIHDVTGLVDEVSEEVEEMIKQWIKEQIGQKGLPPQIVDMLDFSFTENDDIGVPPSRRGEEEQDPPNPVTMGNSCDMEDTGEIVDTE